MGLAYHLQKTNINSNPGWDIMQKMWWSLKGWEEPRKMKVGVFCRQGNHRSVSVAEVCDGAIAWEPCTCILPACISSLGRMVGLAHPFGMGLGFRSGCFGLRTKLRSWLHAWFSCVCVDIRCWNCIPLPLLMASGRSVVFSRPPANV